MCLHYRYTLVYNNLLMFLINYTYKSQFFVDIYGINFFLFDLIILLLHNVWLIKLSPIQCCFKIIYNYNFVIR